MTRILGSGMILGALCLPGRSAYGVPQPEKQPDRLPAKLEFNRDVRPILSDTCFKCHGFDRKARKADLRLDVADEAFKPRDGGTPIVPGHPEKSEAYARLTTADPDEKMPPPKSHLAMTPEQVATVKKWIEQGAQYQPHWAFIPPRDAAAPELNDPAYAARYANWPRNPIDRFILARLEKEGLSPSPEADRRTLIRRVTLDLTGLPPTPAEVEAFLADTSADAYEKVVDRLLASPRYGERMVVDWLDAARYADSNGYQADPTRTMWPWRDWVIRAMNDNLPFDQFTVDQIAGDLLPGATPGQRLASGFNRNHTFNGEGGRISEETRAEDVLDRVDTTSTAFLGLTVGCSKCHDHKYDPITQKEYYQLYAYFNQCSETGQFEYVNGGNVVPVMTVGTPEQDRKSASLREAAKEAESRLVAALPKIDAAQAEWEKSVPPTRAAAVAASAGWTVATPTALVSKNGASLRQQEDGSVLAGGLSPITDVHEVTLRTDLTGVSALRLEALPDASLPHGGPGRSEDTGNFVLTTIEAEAVSVADAKQTKKVAFSGADATYSQPGWPVEHAIDADNSTGWAVWNAPDKSNFAATFHFAEPVGFPGGTELRLRFHYESVHKQHTMGRFRLSLATGQAGSTGSSGSAGSALPSDVSAALAIAPDRRNEQQKKQVREFYRTKVSTEYKPLSDAVAVAKKAADDFDKSVTKVMVMDDAKPRETHVLLRGQYDKPGDKVEPGVPSFLNPLPALPESAKGVTNNRRALAKWLVDPANPLTGRVIVNRYWQSFFGTGLVKTSDDFGTQGEPPSHPELLDWLARRFVAGAGAETGAFGAAAAWDVKVMHRLIVTSATYRQSSRVTPQLLERDPANRLLARGPRFRLSSFAIRDQALAASGLLVEKVGGPPVKPYQPPGVWEEMSLGQIKYEPDKGESLYRRSVYTFWRRTVAPTTMFDVSPRTVCMVRPLRTNTPLQALALLNDTTYVEAARVLSEGLLKDGSTTPGRKLDQVFERFMARDAKEPEKKILLETLDRLRSQFGADPESAVKLVSVGERPRDPKLDPPELASWTALVNLVMNMDEAITKE